MPQQFDPNEFAPKKRPDRPPAGVQKFPISELFGTMWGTEDSILPPVKGLTRPALPTSEGTDWEGWDDMKWLYENVVRPSSSVVGAASDFFTGKAIGAVAKPVIGGAANLYKKFRGAGEAIPDLPIRNVEAPVAELPPIKPELLDDSGRMVAPPQSELPVRPAGPWNDNIVEPPTVPISKQPVREPVITPEKFDEFGNRIDDKYLDANSPEIPIKPELNKPLPSLPIEEGESIGAYLRRNGVDNIHTTPDEQVANRAAQAADPPPVVDIQKPPEVSAKYVFDQPTPEGGTIPMYNIEGGPLHGTTVSAQTLEDMGLPVPEKTAPMQKPLTLEERQALEPPVVPITKPFDSASLRFEGAAKQFDEAEFVNPTTGEIIPESLAGQGDVPLEIPSIAPGIAGRSATKRMGSPDLGLEGVPNAAEMPPIQQPVQQPPTLNTNALSRPAMLDEPWTPVGSLPNEQIPLMDVNPQIPLQPAGIPKPPTPYQPAGVMPQFGPAKPKAPMFGPEPPPPPIPPTPYQPAGIPKQLGPNPPNVPPMGPRKPPQPPANPLVPLPPPPSGPVSSTISAHKAFLTSGDVSAPGRQGKAFILNKAWWTSLDDMFKAWGSKQGSELVNDSIQNHPSGFFNRTTLPNGRQVQSWAEQMGLELPKHEEIFNSTISRKIAEVIPPWIEKSSRAHTAFLNKLRSDQFASMIKASQDAGIDPIKNQHIARAYAKFINDGTGRGSLGKLERNMELMNNVFFAPKNMAGQIRTWNNVLNPAKYYNYDPVLRKQALKSLFAIAGVGLGVGEIARMAGAKVSNDPTSADFRKVRLGDSRIDMFGGYQQFPVAAMKLLTGESTSTISGRTTDLNAGRYGQQTRASVAERFFINRLSPVASFIYAWMNNSEFDGKPFEVKRALFERTFPIAAKDIMELAQEDPALAAIMAPTTMTGLTGTQHYTGR